MQREFEVKEVLRTVKKNPDMLKSEIVETVYGYRTPYGFAMVSKILRIG